MTSSDDASVGIVGHLRVVDGAGVVRIEQRHGCDSAELWLALTDPDRLARWFGPVTGELREGGRVRIRLDGPDIDSTGRVLECRAPSLLRVQTRETEESARRGGGQPFDQPVEVSLTPVGGRTTVVIEVRGLPLSKLAAYGVGWQLHAESLSSHVQGEPPPDVSQRWRELMPRYEGLAAELAR